MAGWRSQQWIFTKNTSWAVKSSTWIALRGSFERKLQCCFMQDSASSGGLWVKNNYPSWLTGSKYVCFEGFKAPTRIYWPPKPPPVSHLDPKHPLLSCWSQAQCASRRRMIGSSRKITASVDEVLKEAGDRNKERRGQGSGENCGWRFTNGLFFICYIYFWTSYSEAFVTSKFVSEVFGQQNNIATWKPKDLQDFEDVATPSLNRSPTIPPEINSNPPKKGETTYLPTRQDDFRLKAPLRRKAALSVGKFWILPFGRRTCGPDQRGPRSSRRAAKSVSICFFEGRGWGIPAFY